MIPLYKYLILWLFRLRPKMARLEKTTIWYSLSNTVKYATGKLIDVWSRNKPYLFIFKDYVTNFWGIDLYQPDARDLEVDIYGDAQKLPLKDASVDTILITQVLQYIPEPKDVLNEFHRVLRQGGHVICVTPFMWRNVEGELYRFSAHGLDYLSGATGFEIVSQQQRGGTWAVLGTTLALHLRSLLNFGKIGRILMFMAVLPIELVALVLDYIIPGTGETLGYTTVFRKV